MFRSPRRRLTALAVAAASIAPAALAAAPTGASAALDPAKVPPIGASVGRFTMPIQCKITLPWLANLQVLDLPASVSVGGAVPASLVPGQKFYLSQASGRLTLPAWLSQIAPIIGATQARAIVPQVNIRAVGASPDTVNMAKTPLVVNGIHLGQNKPISVGLPLSGYFTVGPWTAPNSGLLTLQFAQATAHVDLQTSSGAKILSADAKCTAPSNLALLTIEVGGASGQPDGLIANADVDFPTPPNGYDNGIIHAPYTCNLNGQSYSAGIAYGAMSPLSLPAVRTLSYVNAGGALTLSEDTVNRLLDQGVTTLSGTVRSLKVNAEGATPSQVDPAAGQNISFGPVALVRGQRLVIPAPASGQLTVGPFTRVGSSQIRVSVGDAIFDVKLNGSSTSTAMNCVAPTAPHVFLGASL